MEVKVCLGIEKMTEDNSKTIKFSYTKNNILVGINTNENCTLSVLCGKPTLFNWDRLLKARSCPEPQNAETQKYCGNTTIN